MTKETLKEAAERIAYDSTESNKGFPSMRMFIEGAKWQKKQDKKKIKELQEYILKNILNN